MSNKKQSDDVLARRRAAYAANPGPHRTRAKLYAGLHPDARKEYVARYRAAHPEKVRATRIKNYAQFKARNPGVETARNWARKGIPAPTWPKPTHCELCGGVERTGQALALDHCHTRQIFRGWLCWHCNVGLGNFKDDIGRLHQAIKYLENHVKHQ